MRKYLLEIILNGIEQSSDIKLPFHYVDEYLLH